MIEDSEVKWDLPKCPWVYIADKVLEDLLVSFENVRKEMESPKLEGLRPTLVARVGKVLFYRLEFLYSFNWFISYSVIHLT